MLNQVQYDVINKSMSKEIINKVKANQKLVTIDLAKLFYDPTPIAELDIKDFLHMGLLLKEADFREHLATFDWAKYEGKYLSVFCSTDAIIAPWAWMLVTSHANTFAKEVFHLSAKEVTHELYRRNIEFFDWSQYQNKFVLLKGCGDTHVPDSIYLLATNKLMRSAKKIMYGEACSFVPVWKN
ncbi:MAG: DUF2480 family protein [Balneolaceae bacterium]